MSKKQFETWVNTKDKGAHKVTSFVDTEAEALAEVAIEVLEEEFICDELHEQFKEEIKKFFKKGEDGNVFIPSEFSDNALEGFVIWKGPAIGIGIGSTNDGTDKSTDKWSNRWLECSYIKEQIATTCYVLTDDSISEVMAIDENIVLPETIEMGVFRYEDGKIKIENL